MRIGPIAVLAALASTWAWGTLQASAEEATATRTTSHASPRLTIKHPFPPARRANASAEAAGSGLWLGGAGFALALLGLGAVVLKSRRWSTKPGDESTVIRTAGRVALSPRQAVHLLKVGDRTLLIGTGPQGPPSFLGEWTDSAGTPPKPRTNGEGGT